MQHGWLAQETEDFRAHLDAVPASLPDLEVRLDTKCTDALQAQHDDILSELQRESDELAVKMASVASRTSEVEVSIADVVDAAMQQMERRVDDMQGQLTDTVDNRVEKLNDVIMQHKITAQAHFTSLQSRMLQSEVSSVTLRLACETAASAVQEGVDQCQDALLVLDGRVDSVESAIVSDDDNGWHHELFSDGHLVHEEGRARFELEIDMLQRRLDSLEQSDSINSTRQS